MNLVDTSGWIEYFTDGPNAAFFAPAVEDTARLVVSVVSLYEAAKKVRAAEGEGAALRAIAQMKEGRVATVTEEVALAAAVISLERRLPMADSLIYATARSWRAALWTQDEHFRGLPGVRYCPAQASPRGKS
jgi:predicted nucleic acid-binding protein